VCQVFEHIGRIGKRRHHLLRLEYLVVDNIVVRWMSSALDRSMGLQVEIPVSGFGDAAVDDGAVLRIPGAIDIFYFGRVEAGVVALADNDDCDLGEALFG